MFNFCIYCAYLSVKRVNRIGEKFEFLISASGRVHCASPIPYHVFISCEIVKTENEKRRFVMKVQAFCEEKGLRSFLGVFGYAESKNQCWQAEKWLLHHLICIFPRWPPKLRKTKIAAN